MSPSHVAEPTYEAIRNRLMVGTWPMGHRLEAGRLADELGVSITPVRDGLNRLVGEKLVDLIAGIGFHVPRLTEQQLRNLFDLNLTLLLSAVRNGRERSDGAAADVSGASHAARTDALFVRLAFLSGNEEIVDGVRAIGFRLHATRLHETSILSGSTADLELIQAALLEREPRQNLAKLLKRYHGVRRRNAGRLLAWLELARH